MRFRHPDGSTVHLAYCTNVHPAETLDGVLAQLRDHCEPVRKRLGRDRLGIGLWLARAAAHTLATDPAALRGLRTELDRRGLEVVTLNGFPYEGFGAQEVKYRVYKPDWTDPERLSYTTTLARLLAVLLPDDVTEGSISTLPLAWRTPYDRHPTAATTARTALTTLAERLDALEDLTGKSVRIGLEPEPGCTIETTADAINPLTELSHPRIGVCVDTCHLATSFEDPATALNALTAANIPIAKAQLSAALHAEHPHLPEVRTALAHFAEPRFLHQTRTTTHPPAPSDTQLTAAPDTHPPVAATTDPVVSADARPAVTADGRPVASADARPAVTATTDPVVTADVRPAVTATTGISETATTRPSTASDARRPVAVDVPPPVASEAQRLVAADARPPVVAEAHPPVGADAQRPVGADARLPVGADAQRPVAADALRPVTADACPPVVAEAHPHVAAEAPGPVVADARPHVTADAQRPVTTEAHPPVASGAHRPMTADAHPAVAASTHRPDAATTHPPAADTAQVPAAEASRHRTTPALPPSPPSRTLHGTDDLAEALTTTSLPTTTPWRAHFHVPLHAPPAPPLTSTLAVLQDALAHLVAHPSGHPLTHHLEVETYTWQALPPELRPRTRAQLADGIAAELTLARDLLTDLGLKELP